MKKHFLTLLGIITFSFAANAQTDSASRSNYYFYPESNVYYNPATKNYSYFDQNTSKWSTVTTLPSTYSINAETPKSTITYNGSSVWENNKQHQATYGQPLKTTPVSPTPTPAPANTPKSPAGTTPPKPGK